MVPHIRTRRKGVSADNAEQVIKGIKETTEALNALLRDLQTAGAPSALLTQLQKDIYGTVAEVFDVKQARVRTAFGLDFDFRDMEKDVVNFSRSGQRRFISQIKTYGGAVATRTLFFGSASAKEAGFVGKLMHVLEQAETDLQKQLGPVGAFIDMLT